MGIDTIDAEAAAILKEGLSVLPKGDQGFASSLLSQLDNKGSLSAKQWHWVRKLAEAVETTPVPDFTLDLAIQLGTFSAVISMFTDAKKYLKHPKIRLQLASGTPLQIALAGPTSKAPGTVTLTDGGPWGNSVFYGRVTASGLFEPSKITEERKAELVSILRKLAKAPAEVAAAHGKLVGRCCLCNSQLSDAKSTAVGYGATCAKRWNLPWGAQRQDTTPPHFAADMKKAVEKLTGKKLFTNEPLDS